MPNTVAFTPRESCCGIMTGGRSGHVFSTQSSSQRGTCGRTHVLGVPNPAYTAEEETRCTVEVMIRFPFA